MKWLRFPLVATAASGFAIAVLAAAIMPSRTAVLADSLGSVSPAAPMLEPRSGHSATLLPDGRILIAGGMFRNQDFYRSAEVYDPATGKFQPTGEMSVARVGHAAVLLQSGNVLIVGGWIGHGCTDSAELYDPATGKFLAIAKMTTRRGQPSATLLVDGDVLITGGADHDTPGGIASSEVFHARTLTFEPVGSMHYARISHTATLLNDGRVLIAGGRGENVIAIAELYDPKTKQFVPTSHMLTARYKHTAGLLFDGRVLIAGGSDERDWQGALSSAEIYDPHTGKFAATSPLNDSRFKLPAEAVSLPSGQLLIAGGSKQVEIYNPKMGKFVLASGQLSDAWHFMTETRLKDGRVLLTGGYPDNDQATAQTWIYRP
jgi:Galactose oxidase, central domain/Kelch motif